MSMQQCDDAYNGSGDEYPEHPSRTIPNRVSTHTEYDLVEMISIVART